MLFFSKIPCCGHIELHYPVLTAPFVFSQLLLSQFFSFLSFKSLENSCFFWNRMLFFFPMKVLIYLKSVHHAGVLVSRKKATELKHMLSALFRSNKQNIYPSIFCTKLMRSDFSAVWCKKWPEALKSKTAIRLNISMAVIWLQSRSLGSKPTSNDRFCVLYKLTVIL